MVRNGTDLEERDIIEWYMIKEAKYAINSLNTFLG